MDAFIVADLGVLDACKTFAPDIDVHLSTQTLSLIHISALEPQPDEEAKNAYFFVTDLKGNYYYAHIEFTDFCKEYPNVKISMQKTGGIFHDRFIVLDYGISKYAPVIAALLKNPTLILPR